MVEGGQIAGHLLPLPDEFLAAFLNFVQIEEFFDGNRPADRCHDRAEKDDHPAVEHHVLGDVSEEHDVLKRGIVTAAPAALVLAGDDQFCAGVIARLAEVGEIDPAGAAGGFGNLKFVHLADHAILSVVVSSERCVRSQGGNRRRNVAIFFSVHIKSRRGVRGHDGHMLPDARRHRFSGHSFLGPRAIFDFHVRDTCRKAELKPVSAIGPIKENALVVQGCGLDPGRDRQRLAGGLLKGRALGNFDRGISEKPHSGTDQ